MSSDLPVENADQQSSDVFGAASISFFLFQRCPQTSPRTTWIDVILEIFEFDDRLPRPDFGSQGNILGRGQKGICKMTGEEGGD